MFSEHFNLKYVVILCTDIHLRNPRFCKWNRVEMKEKTHAHGDGSAVEQPALPPVLRVLPEQKNKTLSNLWMLGEVETTWAPFQTKLFYEVVMFNA